MSIIEQFFRAKKSINGIISVAFDDGAGRIHSCAETWAEYKEKSRLHVDAVVMTLLYNKHLNQDVQSAMGSHGLTFLRQSVKGYGRVCTYYLREPDCEGIGSLEIEVALGRGHYAPFYEVTEQAFKQMLKGNFGQPTLSSRFREKVIVPLRKATCGF